MAWLAHIWRRARGTDRAPRLLLLIVYLAGSDPFREDRLGGLSLTHEGLRRRDRLVLDAASAAGVPVAIVLAGGYAGNVEDTVTAHVNTVLEARNFAV